MRTCTSGRIDMATFILTIDWTDQGIRNVRDAPKRSQAAKELAKKVGVEIKDIYLTSGAHDILVLAEAPLGDHITKFALALGSLGNVRTSTSRAWTEAEWTKLISELP
ncbi:GYD family protein [Bradyrhizobium neotropicale]|uniref:GYD family protein n=2 Tax=Bradyrhizobium neotropicale TaxID=1497615 RepID=A0A176Z7U5_9BRAD|nr:GYD family protein [Bradyrhizobium neotropicale]